MPADLSRIIGCPRLELSRIDLSEVDDADRPAARITSGIAEGVQLLQLRSPHTGFLEQFAPGRGFQSLFRFHETTRNCPYAAEWIVLAPDQQDPWLLFVSHDHHIHRH